MQKYTLFLMFIFLTVANSHSQDLPVKEDDQNVDTVIIKDDPVIIRTVTYLPSFRNRKKMLELYVSPVIYSNYYRVCSSCAGFVQNLKRDQKPALSHSAGISFTYIRNKFSLSPGLGYTVIRENFKSPDFQGGILVHNKYYYLDLNLYAGYNIERQRALWVLSLFGTASMLMDTEGKTISESDFVSVINLPKDRFKNFSYTLGVSLKTFYALSYNLDFLSELYFRNNISSLTNRHHDILVDFRNMGGMKFGFGYKF